MAGPVSSQARGREGARVALLDIAPGGRIGEDKGWAFPFLLGFLRREGIRATWLVLPPGAYERDRATLRVELADEARRWLGERLERLAITHCLASEAPEPALERWLAARAEVLSFTKVGHEGRAYGAALLERLGFPAAGQLPDLAAPVFECESPRPLADDELPNTRVVAGPACRFSASIAANPFYRGVDLSRCSNQRGCAFCIGASESRKRFKTPPLELALGQISAVRAARRPARHPRRFEIRSHRLTTHVDELLDAVLLEGIAPSSFYLSCRADDVVAHEDALRRGVRLAERAGHRLVLASIGAENFSDVENQRLNKGLTTATVLRAVDVLQGLEHDHPDAFSYGAAGGLGFILFTPWTTAENLRQNVAVVRRIAAEHARFFLTRRLMLWPGYAITALAERDGLVGALDAQARELFELMIECGDPGCRHWAGERDLPWRFQDATAASLCGIIFRMAATQDIQGDRWQPELRSALAGAGSGDGLLAAVELLLDVAGAPGPPATFEELVTRFLGALRSTRREAAVVTDHRRRAWVEALRRLLGGPRSPVPGLELRAHGASREGSLDLRFEGPGERLIVEVCPVAPGRTFDLTRAGLGFRASGRGAPERRARLLEVVARVCTGLTR